MEIAIAQTKVQMKQTTDLIFQQEMKKQKQKMIEIMWMRVQKIVDLEADNTAAQLKLKEG